MAFRFLAILTLGTADRQIDSAALQSHLELPFAHASDDLLVLSESDPCPLPIGDNRGLVLGHLFGKNGSGGLIKQLRSKDSQSIEATKGQSLINAFWGGYIAFVKRSGNPSGWRVIRDPSGALPCYFLTTPHSIVFASDIETLVDAGIYSPRINWTGIRQHLLAYDLRTTETCLSDISELLAGQCLDVGQEGVTLGSIWLPWDHVRATDRREPASFAGDLQEVTTRCLFAWADAFPTVLLGISGGLDSSIIAATLGRDERSVTCLTMATDHVEGDERAYARLAASAARLPLIERFHDVRHIDVRQSTARHLPRPVLPALAQSEYRTKVALTKELAASAYFIGIGGDNVFCHMRSATPFVDRILSSGLDRNAWRTLNDICDLTNCAYWDVGLMAFHRLRKGGRRYAWTCDNRLLNADIPVLTPSHAWLAAPPEILPGKAAHVAMLLRIQGTIDGFPRRGMVPMINPLLSQPIIELCLAIPTWAWIEGGVDRAVARRAFSDRLPPPLVARKSKGGPGTFAAQILEQSRHEILDLLDGGLLDRERLIDIPTSG